MILVLDNRDSFTFNLAQALERLGHVVEVVRARDTDAETLLARRPGALLVGPGPGRPEDARTSLALFSDRAGALPLLGVCLGHQALAVAHGARVGRAATLVHGRTVEVLHEGAGVLAGLPSPFRATRYNSLTVDADSLPADLEVTARTADGDVMALRHRAYPWQGVQFHPESVLSEHGDALLANFARQCVSACADRPPASSAATVRPTVAAARRPPRPGVDA